MSPTVKDVLVVLAVLIYVVCPLDFDFIPVLGWIDDAVVIGAAIAYFRRRRAERRIEATTPANDDDVIDAEFTVNR